MAGSSYGTIFRITTFGESHGEALGVVIDGCPAGLSLSPQQIQVFLDRRKPGKSPISTARQEADEVEILSGVFEGKTTGTPILMLFKNTSSRSSDYSNIANCYRPGHADYTYESKYGFRDYRGGGRSSGRETVGRVAAGAVASLLLRELGISLLTYTLSIGPVKINREHFEEAVIRSSLTGMPDSEADQKAVAYLNTVKKELDSAGGSMECRITGMPSGIGDPVFEKLDANLCKAVMSIGAVKAVEIGDGIHVSAAIGSRNNDFFCSQNGKIQKESNHAGGILGGISDGSPIIVRAHVKPTPSIYKEQKTVDNTGKEMILNIAGRHDPIIVPRALVVMESMIAITILDAMMINMSARMDRMKDFYNK